MTAKKKLMTIDLASCQDLRSALIAVVNHAYNLDMIRGKRRVAALHLVSFEEFRAAFIAVSELRDAYNMDMKRGPVKLGKFSNRIKARVGQSLFDLTWERIDDLLTLVKTVSPKTLEG